MKEDTVMKSKIKKSVVVIISFIVFTLFQSGAAWPEIKLGVLPRLSAVEMTAMFGPLAEYLSKETGEKVSLVIPKDFAAYMDAVKSGQVDLGYSNPVVYVELKEGVSLEPLALTSEVKGGTKFRGIIIARKDSGIQKVQDLKGKKLIFVDKDSAAGYVFQMHFLSEAGLDVKKDFTTLPFAKKHDNVTMAVFNKAADAGGIREDDFDKMKDKVDLSQIKIVGYTEFFPNWPVYATPKLAKDKAGKVREALLKLKPNDPQAAKVLNPAKLTGCVPVTDKDYDNLRKALKLVREL